MRIGALLLGLTFCAMGSAGCSTMPTDGNGKRLVVVCKVNQPCEMPVAVTTKMTGVIFPSSCKVNFLPDSSTTIGPGTDVSWTLPPVSVGNLEFVGPPGIDITSPAPDFIDRGYGSGGTDRGTYVWSGNTDRTKVPRKYKFQVVWVNWFTDRPLPCGTIDPTIVNSL